jgi:hypothetical protein
MRSNSDKSCRKKLKPGKVFLFNDILVYGTVIINGNKYNKQKMIPLENMELQNLAENNDPKNGWVIKTPAKYFAVFVPTADEKVKRMANINHCIEALKERTGSRPELEYAAVWVPDKASPNCMACKVTNFTVLNIRHDCRNCGTIVCGACSQNKFSI